MQGAECMVMVHDSCKSVESVRGTGDEVME